MYIYKLSSDHDEDAWVILDHEMPDEILAAYTALGYVVKEMSE